MLKLTCFLPCILENNSTKIQEANGNLKKGSVAILIDEIDFKIKNKTIDTERHYKMIKGSTKKKT